ncbi:MAG TPA: FAD-dependent monooxygenase [Natronosporangium sp.]|nr:FAD-dependent monooxygenase [Natronosporangium sp.]
MTGDPGGGHDTGNGGTDAVGAPDAVGGTGAVSGGTEVLIVGAGPTGLSLAVQLAAHGVRPRLIDRAADRAHESRALAVQPRTLEVLAAAGLSDRLVAAGNPAVRLQLHGPGRRVEVKVFDLGLADTAYPYLLLVSQAETERILLAHLATAGVRVERRTELVDLHQTGDAVVATLRHLDGRTEVATSRYLVGCDGAHSTVRRLSGIAFHGGTYPRTFVLADLAVDGVPGRGAADGLDPGAAHAFLSRTGVLFFFPLGHPAPWRLIAMRPPGDPTPAGAPVALADLQALADAHRAGVRLRDPVWMTNFRLHHKVAVRYRRGRVFLAGDAAHIHSPAGGQGMNTGIQDAVNLGWKLAQVARGRAGDDLLDTYESERLPVGRAVLRLTDRAFTAATSTNRLVAFARTRIVPLAAGLALRFRRGRAYAFRTVAQLGIRYRRSPLSVEGPHPPARGPRAGDRLPDAPVRTPDGPATLHDRLTTPGWHLLLCGPPGAWREPYDLPDGWLTVHRLPDGDPLCAVGSTAHYLVRPDGHVGYRAGGTDLAGLTGYLRRWLPAPTGARVPPHR